MKRTILSLLGGCCLAIAVIFGVNYFTSPADAQRNVLTRYEYAVITGTYQPYPADNPGVASSAVQICYLRATGCQTEEVRSDVSIAKFLQDERIENSPRARSLAQESASQLGFSKAIAKLGNDGWEIISAPAIEFDIYYTNPQGIPSVKEGSKTDRQHVWFRRARQ